MPVFPSRLVVLCCALLLGVLAGALLWWTQWQRPVSVPVQAARWVDESRCGTCHAAEFELWQGSHHAQAMQAATPATVRGDFAAPALNDDRERTEFIRDEQGYAMRTPGADGRVERFPVAYSFGLEPLQQYLLALPDGSLQAHDAGWDTGRKRWFHLYADQGVDAGHPLHWSGSSQNANAMCIECHSTAYERRFDPRLQRFSSRWAGSGVGCQGCHGPASVHLDWARGERQTSVHRTFAFDVHAPGNGAQVEVCARCHSRRTRLGGDDSAGGRLYDDLQPAGLTAELYEVDGKIRDEVFEYGSFAQSRMHAAGVRCSDCHEPHGGTLRAEGNALCLQCHNPQAAPRRSGIASAGLREFDYQSAEHHRHRADSPGAQCANCHMPGKLYMQLDHRRDHSFSVPNPQQALALGHGDACLGCHQGQASSRIVAAYRQWYGDTQPRDGGYAQALSKARKGQDGAAEALLGQLARTDLPGLRKAALLAELSRYPSRGAREVAIAALDHPEPPVRLAALEVLPGLLDPQALPGLLRPMLQDARRAVRLAATWQLLQLPAEWLAGDALWQQSLKAYRDSQLAQQDRAEALTNLALLEAQAGRLQPALAWLDRALLRDRHFHPARVLRAQLRGQAGEDSTAVRELREAIAEYPDQASLRHALGLALVRQGEPAQALDSLERAWQLEPDSAELAYVLAIARHDAGRPQEAIELLRRQLERDPSQRNLRAALVDYLRRQGRDREALATLEALRRINPQDPLL